MKIHKGDNVKIMVGKDRGKTGKVLKVDLAAGSITVENLNMFKRHRRARKQGEKGEIVSVARPIDASNVKVVCSSCGKPTRVGYRISGEGANKQKSRTCKNCQAII